MEFHLALRQPATDLNAVRASVCALDPSALLDTDAFGTTLRISTMLDASELVSSVRNGGLAITEDQLVRIASVCCGGCSG
jgi:hypothetical protein